MSVYIMPLLILFVLIFAKIKKVNAYNSFCAGAKDGFNLVLDIMPYICAIMLVIAFMRYSGLGEFVIKALSPVLNFCGVPSELTEFIMLRPFTGSGSLALLQDIITTYGADSKITRIACTIMGSSETVLFVSALYFAKTSAKNVGKAIAM
ncbi:MAG: nucleoside recognition domain-containing protein, partial [Christensenellales bacterium]